MRLAIPRDQALVPLPEALDPEKALTRLTNTADTVNGFRHRVILSVLHVEPHLVVGQVGAGHGALPERGNPHSYPAHRDHQIRPQTPGNRRHAAQAARATPSRLLQRRYILILIVAALSS